MNSLNQLGIAIVSFKIILRRFVIYCIGQKENEYARCHRTSYIQKTKDLFVGAVVCHYQNGGPSLSNFVYTKGGEERKKRVLNANRVGEMRKTIDNDDGSFVLI